MAPPEGTVKEIRAKGRASPIDAIKKTTLVKTVDKPLKINKRTASVTRKRTSTVPNVAPKVGTPKPREKTSVPAPGSATQSAKKRSTWKRRQKPAHSGVPMPEKMKRLLEKQCMLSASDTS